MQSRIWGGLWGLLNSSPLPIFYIIFEYYIINNTIYYIHFMILYYIITNSYGLMSKSQNGFLHSFVYLRYMDVYRRIIHLSENDLPGQTPKRLILCFCRSTLNVVHGYLNSFTFFPLFFQKSTVRNIISNFQVKATFNVFLPLFTL